MSFSHLPAIAQAVTEMMAWFQICKAQEHLMEYLFSIPHLASRLLFLLLKVRLDLARQLGLYVEVCMRGRMFHYQQQL
jgi:hypothetical protein